MSLQRIVIAARRFARIGGAESHIEALTALLIDAGHEVLAIADSSDAATLGAVPGLTDEPVGPTTLLAVDSLLSRFRPTIIHSHDLLDPALHHTFRTHAPTVWSVHNYLGCSSGSWSRRLPARCSRPHGAGCLVSRAALGCAGTRRPQSVLEAFRLTTRRLAALRDADLVLAYSLVVRDHLRRNGVPRVRQIPLFVPGPSGPAARQGPERRVLFVGRVTPHKGLDVLVRAMVAVDGMLEVCGDGWGLESARQLARRLGVADRVTFAGWLDPDLLQQAYRRANVVAVPSLWPEPFGLVGLEAMAAGRPVVASATGGIPEWLDSGRNGILVPPNQPLELGRALAALLGDLPRASAMGEAGARDVAARFGPGRHLENLARAYELAAATRAAR